MVTHGRCCILMPPDRRAAEELSTSHLVTHTVPVDARGAPAGRLTVVHGRWLPLRLPSAQAGTRPTMSTTPRRPRMRQSRVPWLLDRLEREADAVIDALRKGVQAPPLGGGRRLLPGRCPGQPVRPLMAQVPIGSWMSAAVPDLRPGRSHEAGLPAERRRMETGAHEHGS